MQAHSLLGNLILKLSQERFERDKAESFEPTIFLSQGDDLLEEYGVPAAIIELPGQTKGSIGFKIGKSDVIVGDALMNMPYSSKSPFKGNGERRVKDNFIRQCDYSFRSRQACKKQEMVM